VKKIITFFLAATLIESSVIAQQLYTQEASVLLKNEVVGGVFLHTQGFGFNYRKAKNITALRKWFWEIDGLSMYHPKETNTVNPYLPNAKSYVFGKLNSFDIIRAGYGRQNIIFGRENKGGIEIRYNYSAGLSMGFTIPIYLDLYVPTPNGDYQETIQKYDPVNDPPENILGKASFTYGLGEIQPHPGLYGKFGFSFEDTNENHNIYVLETGVAVDAYPKQIPIMAFTQNNSVFLTLYVNFMFGKKW
jgi:hypothetical protein